MNTLFQGLTGNRLAAIENYFRKLPNKYGDVSKSGLFTEKPKNARSIVFQGREGILSIIEPGQPGAPAEYSSRLHAKTYAFVMNSFKREGIIWASDLADIARIDDAGVRVTTENEAVFEELDNQGIDHDITVEHALMSALQGKVVTGAGYVLVDLHQEFGISRTYVDWDLANSATSISGVMDSMIQYFEDNLKGETMSGIDVRCTRNFIKKLKANSDIKDMFKQSSLSELALMQPTGMGLPYVIPGYPMVRFFEYNGNGPVRLDDGTVKTIKFLPEPTGYDGQAVAYPTGTTNTFMLFTGPAERFSAINTAPSIGGRYTLITRDPEDRWIKISTERVMLPVVKRPELTMTIYG